MIEDFARLIPESLMCKTGSVFFSGRTAFSNPSNLYILGINPGGGDPENTPESSISRHIENVLTKRSDDWLGYRDDCWGGKCPGEHFLQKNVLHLLEKTGTVKAKAHNVPTSEVVFLKSKDESDLKRLYGKSYEELADKCWPFHEAVIEKLGVRVVVCYGRPSGEYVRQRLDATEKVDEFIVPLGETGKRKSRAFSYRNTDGIAVVNLWFPGNGQPYWINPKTDPTELVVNALAG